MRFMTKPQTDPFKAKKFMPAHEVPKFALTTALRVSAACRHYSQSSLRGRKWIPEDLSNKPNPKRVQIFGKSADLSLSPSDDEEPEDDELEEIQQLESMTLSASWPSDFLRLVSTEFIDCSFMDDDDDDGDDSHRARGSP